YLTIGRLLDTSTRVRYIGRTVGIEIIMEVDWLPESLPISIGESLPISIGDWPIERYYYNQILHNNSQDFTTIKQWLNLAELTIQTEVGFRETIDHRQAYRQRILQITGPNLPDMHRLFRTFNP